MLAFSMILSVSALKIVYDLALLLKAIPAQWFPAASWIKYGKKIRDGGFSGATGFKIDGGMKDAAFIRRLGAETSTPTPIIDQVWNHLTTAKAIGGPRLDWSACSAGMRVTAGLPPFKGEDFTLSESQKIPLNESEPVKENGLKKTSLANGVMNGTKRDQVEPHNIGNAAVTSEFAAQSNT